MNNPMLAAKRVPAWKPISPPLVNDGPIACIVNGVVVRPGDAFPDAPDAVYVPSTERTEESL